LPAEGTACDWVIQKRQWIVTASREELRERFPATFQIMTREGMESLCAIPLLTGENCLGVLFCMAAAKGAYRDLPHALLEKIAVAAAVALDDCFAHEELRQLRDRLAAENVYLQEEIKTEYNFEEIIGQSAPLKQLLRKIEQVARTETTVLVQGETGTGKELLARAIHNLSPRKERPLVKVNCGAIPAGLVESELFGHEKGAFTGALQQRIGRFELADGGTLFLDEVGELPLDTQTKLLRVLQEGEFERVGSNKAIKVNVRIIAATNRDLRQTVKSGSFRSDLFYRLNVFPMVVPPLRERRSDIPLLVNFFLSRYAKRLGKQLQGVSRATMDRLTQYSWPGNIRELQNLIERAVVVAEGPIVRIDDSILGLDASVESQGPQALDDLERAHILRVLTETNWVVHGSQGAASILEINPSTLRSRMQKLGIRKPSRSSA
jgi:formate hydrogenlyase transcriptional activator